METKNNQKLKYNNKKIICNLLESLQMDDGWVHPNHGIDGGTNSIFNTKKTHQIRFPPRGPITIHNQTQIIQRFCTYGDNYGTDSRLHE